MTVLAWTVIVIYLAGVSIEFAMQMRGLQPTGRDDEKLARFRELFPDTFFLVGAILSAALALIWPALVLERLYDLAFSRG